MFVTPFEHDGSKWNEVEAGLTHGVHHTYLISYFGFSISRVQTAKLTAAPMHIYVYSIHRIHTIRPISAAKSYKLFLCTGCVHYNEWAYHYSTSTHPAFSQTLQRKSSQQSRAMLDM